MRRSTLIHSCGSFKGIESLINDDIKRKEKQKQAWQAKNKITLFFTIILTGNPRTFPQRTFPHFDSQAVSPLQYWVMPCIEPLCWGIVRILPFYFQVEECADFIAAAEGATPRNRSGIDQLIDPLDRLQQAIWRAPAPVWTSATEGAIRDNIP